MRREGGRCLRVSESGLRARRAFLCAGARGPVAVDGSRRLGKRPGRRQVPLGTEAEVLLQGDRAPESPRSGGSGCGLGPAGPAEQWAGRDSRGWTRGAAALSLLSPGRLEPSNSGQPRLDTLPPRLNSGPHSRSPLCPILSPRTCVSACLSEHLCHPSVCIRPYLSSVFISHLPSVGPLSVSITYQLSVPTVCIYPLYHLCLSALTLNNP